MKYRLTERKQPKIIFGLKTTFTRISMKDVARLNMFNTTSM